MIRSLLFFSVFISSLGCTRSQSVTEHQNDFPLFLYERDLKGGTLITEKTYDGSSLWGYINGGADLYLEYGFKKLFLQEISKDQKTYKIEIYQMIDPESAFGIFSVSRFKCKSDSSISALNCVMPYQIQLVIGSCYISIINQKASEGERVYTRFLCDQVVKLVEPEPFDYPELFRDSIYAGHLGGLMMMKGPIGLINGFPDWSDRFERFTDYQMYLLPVKISDKNINIAEIDFFNNKTQKEFFRAFNLVDTMKSTLQIIQLKDRQSIGILKTDSSSVIYIDTNADENMIKHFLQSVYPMQPVQH